MENSTKNIDLLFLKKFEDFRVNPPESIWEKIKANLPKNPMGGLSGSSFVKTFVVVLILAVPAYFLLNQQEKTTTSPLDNKSVPDTKLTTNNITESTKNEIVTVSSDVVKTDIESPLTVIGEIVKHTVAKAENITKETPKTQIVKNKTLATDTIPEVEKQSFVIADNDLLLAYLPKGSSEIKTEKPTINNIGSKSEVTVFNTNKKRKGYFRLGAYVNPEMIFYPSDDTPNKTNLNLNLSLSYNYSKLFFESGLGIGLAKDDGNFNIDYERYEYLGSYENVYNVTFDSTENGVVPTFYTNTVDVYDSIRHIQVSQTQNSYTYLQIPLFVGYKINSNKFSYSIKGGTSLSLLVFEKIPEATLPSGNISIINLSENTPGRIKTLWHFMVSAGIEYKLSDRMSIAVEPTFRYYMKSVYERNYFTTKHPFSIGLRTGILIKL